MSFYTKSLEDALESLKESTEDDFQDAVDQIVTDNCALTYYSDYYEMLKDVDNSLDGNHWDRIMEIVDEWWNEKLIEYLTEKAEDLDEDAE